ncbi:MAG: tRNA (adenosine(37)-N6)-dimethylallyltransferase MiaA [Candidatus Omnitrophica bacterium]|nr:tRNA (adenosine(37)-N6)-dimethylallyltransferase MiaA [Candidatus Omnitrophota bacterium]
MNPIICIVGPTASGKTQTSYLLARKLGVEIISCDSMLIYREPSIITSKPSHQLLAEVNHHFIGITSVSETYSVFDYFRLATEAIRALYFKNQSPVVCGGSGLYFKAIIDGIFQGPGKNDQLRESLMRTAETYGKQYLYEELKKVDSPAAMRISPNDLRRTIRALEVYYESGMPMSQKQTFSFGLWGDLPIKIFGLRLKRKELYHRIEERVDQMFVEGAVDEVEALRQGNLSLTAEKIIGVKEISEFLDDKVTEAQAKANMKKNTRHLAKRQITWFKKEKRIEWIDIDEQTPKQTAELIESRISNA